MGSRVAAGTLMHLADCMHAHADVCLPTLSDLSKPPGRYLPAIHTSFVILYVFPVPGFKVSAACSPPCGRSPPGNLSQPHLLHLV